MNQLLLKYQQVKVIPRLQRVAREYVAMKRVHELAKAGKTDGEDFLLELWDATTSAETAEKELQKLITDVEAVKALTEKALIT